MEIEPYQWTGGLVTGLVAAVVVSGLLWKFYGRVDGKPTANTWYFAMRAFLPIVFVGFLLFWVATRPASAKVTSLTATPDRAVQGQKVTVVAVVKPGEFPVKSVSFSHNPEDVTAFAHVFGTDWDGSDGWRGILDTSELEPGVHLLRATPHTERGPRSPTVIELRVDAKK
jgi:membrane protein implicated in regulation of membrane protease activity